jgi:hypothetical protein
MSHITMIIVNCSFMNEQTLHFKKNWVYTCIAKSGADDSSGGGASAEEDEDEAQRHGHMPPSLTRH